ncbi:MAG: hypothetical protein HYZ36_06270, partial [Pedosphaera parvula]|nr:hypothetical protein [Pedosphaera parvula]
MIALKIQCPCGQRFAFDVEPVDGHMPTAVACPACGADNTAGANQAIAASTASVSAGGLSLASRGPETAAPLPVPAASLPPPVAPAERKTKLE